MRVRAHAPGRVNLIGDHTDYAGGLALPMAIDLGTTVTGTVGGATIRLRSEQPGTEPVEIPIDLTDPLEVPPGWGRYVAGIVTEVRPTVGFDGVVTSDLPIGGGLSSSAALELAIALALGFAGEAAELAAVGQRAEQRATGVPCGIMDQLTSACGREGHALLVDFSTLAIRPIPLPPDAEIVVIDSGQARTLVGSAYADRRQQVEQAIALLGPLRDLPLDALDAIDDPLVRHRARHVVTENERVRAAADALTRDDLARAGDLMVASHESLRDDFEVSTPALDALVDRLIAMPGVHGARLTGAGFGGCVVALTEPGALDEGWTVHASGGAAVDVTP